MMNATNRPSRASIFYFLSWVVLLTDRYLFTVDSSKKTEEILQCKTDGARNCKAVRLNPSLLSSPPSSQFLKLLSGSDVELQVLRGPADLNSPTLSYQFSLTDGGDGSLTYRPSTSAAIGTFRPSTGSVHYTVESCGDGCNVIYERDSDYFNQFEDWEAMHNICKVLPPTFAPPPPISILRVLPYSFDYPWFLSVSYCFISEGITPFTNCGKDILEWSHD